MLLMTLLWHYGLPLCLTESCWFDLTLPFLTCDPLMQSPCDHPACLLEVQVVHVILFLRTFSLKVLRGNALRYFSGKDHLQQNLGLFRVVLTLCIYLWFPMMSWQPVKHVTCHLCFKCMLGKALAPYKSISELSPMCNFNIKTI